MSSFEWRLAAAVALGVVLDAVFFWKFQPYTMREALTRFALWLVHGRTKARSIERLPLQERCSIRLRRIGTESKILRAYDALQLNSSTDFDLAAFDMLSNQRHHSLRRHAVGCHDVGIPAKPPQISARELQPSSRDSILRVKALHRKRIQFGQSLCRCGLDTPQKKNLAARRRMRLASICGQGRYRIAHCIGTHASLVHLAQELRWRHTDTYGHRRSFANLVFEDAKSLVQRCYKEVDDTIANGLSLRGRIGACGQCGCSGDVCRDHKCVADRIEFASPEETAAQTQLRIRLLTSCFLI